MHYVAANEPCTEAHVDPIIPSKKITDDPDFSLGIDGLSKIIPIVAVGFALAFDVGYFYSIDIGWFSFFTVAEHVEFALRALPVAIAGTVLFLFLLFLNQLETLFQPAFEKIINKISMVVARAQKLQQSQTIQIAASCISILMLVIVGYFVNRPSDQTYDKEPDTLLDAVIGFMRLHPGLATSFALGVAVAASVYVVFVFCRFQLVKSLWIGSLISSVVYVSVFRGYFVLAISLLALAVTTFIYWQINDWANKDWQSDKLRTQFRVLFLFLNLMVFTFFVGFLTSMSWYIDHQYSHQFSLLIFEDGECLRGQVMHPGDKELLFYQRKGDGKQSGVRLFPRDHVKAVRLCEAEHKCAGVLVASTEKMARLDSWVPESFKALFTLDEVREAHGDPEEWIAGCKFQG
jgi:hypothetical protein